MGESPEMIVDVIIPSLGRPVLTECVASLKYLPFPMKLLVMLNESWPASINAALKVTNNDVVIMDDDVRLLPDTFSVLPKYMGHADIFGFKLMFPNGRIQHAGGILQNGNLGHIGHKQIDIGQFDTPRYMSHLCGGLLYIKRHVFEKVGFMAEDYPGVSFEDVDFSFRALKAGFKMLYLPYEAIHLESATKATMDNISELSQQNYLELKKRHLTEEFTEMAGEYPRVLYED